MQNTLFHLDLFRFGMHTSENMALSVGALRVLKYNYFSEKKTSMNKRNGLRHWYCWNYGYMKYERSTEGSSISLNGKHIEVK